MAGQLHGATRVTQDVDILVRRTDRNLDHIGAALHELNARLRAEGLSDQDALALPRIWDRKTLGAMEITTLRTDGGDLDILTDIPARDGQRLRYEDLAADAVEIAIRPGLVARIASTEAVIASKEWADRPKDHEALPELRAIAAREHPRGSAPSGP